MVRLAITSDTHLGHASLKMPEADVLIHCGDLTNRGDIVEVGIAANWLIQMKKKYEHVLLCPGNHDRLSQRDPALFRSMLPGIEVLIDSWAVIDGLIFYGSPWTRACMGWHWQLYTKEEAEHRWAMIPDKVDVLITHGPPHGILDDKKGCPALLKRVLEVKPQIHAFGHIHEGYGQKFFEGTHFINAAAGFRANPPIVVEL